MKFLLAVVCLISVLSAQKSDHMLTRLRGSYDVGEGIGYRDGFASLETFWGYNRTENFIGFLDAIGHIFDHGKIAANLGLGARFNIPSLSTMFGINGFYDYRRTNSFHYDQVGAGLEVLSKYFDIRANGYLPFGQKSHFVRNKFNRFQGFDIIFDEITEEVLRGLDGEVGFNLLNLGPFRFYAAGGAYFYERKDCITHLGGQGRLELSAWQRFFAQVSITGDSLYNTRVQGQFALDVPLYSIKPRKTLNYPQLKRNLYTSVNAYLTQPVIRHPIIPVCRQKLERSLLESITHPILNIPFLFYHVNNAAAPGGNGSFEHPFQNLATAESVTGPADVIFVNPGNHTFGGYQTGFVTKPGQSFWGTGVSHILDVNNQRRRLIIPPFTATNPRITNVYGDGVTLANFAHVAGINIVTPANSGIVGSNVTGVNVNRNRINSPSISGIELDYTGSSTGSSFIAGNTIEGPTLGSSIIISTNDTSIATATIIRNTVSNNETGIAFDTLDMSTFNGFVSHNTVTSSTFQGIGIIGAFGQNGNVNAEILSNTISNVGSGVTGALLNLQASGAASVVNAKIIDNILSNQSGQTAAFGLGVGIIGGTSATAVVKNNQVLGSFPSGSAYSLIMSGVGQFDVQDNIATDGRFAINNADTTCLRLLNNQAPSYVFNNTGTLSVESSTYDTSNPSAGVEQANQGSFIFNNLPVTFVAPNTCTVND